MKSILQSCPRLLTLLCWLTCLAFHGIITLPSIGYPGLAMDEGMVLTYPSLISNGMVPQRDFETLYPPGNIWLLSAAYKFFGTNIFVERYVALGYHMLLITGLFFLLRRQSRQTAMAGCFLTTMISTHLMCVAFAWIGAMSFAVCALAVISGTGMERWRSVCAGILCALSLTWRADLAPAFILGFGSYFYLGSYPKNGIKLFFLGASAGFIPLFIHVCQVGPVIFCDSVFWTPVIRLHGTRTLALDKSQAQIGELYTLMMLSVFLAIFAGWKKFASTGATTEKRKQSLILLCAGLFCLGALSQGLHRLDSTHICFLAILALPWGVMGLVHLSQWFLTPVSALVGAIILCPQTYDNAKGRLVELNNPEIARRMVGTIGSASRPFPMSISPLSKSYRDVFEKMKMLSKPGETLFVGGSDLRFAYGNDVCFYYLLPWLVPASYFVELNPLSANRENSSLCNDLPGADWLILNTIWKSTENNKSQIPGPNLPNQIVQEHFKLVYKSGPIGIFHNLASEKPEQSLPAINQN